jgi:hypothetical protein
VGAPGYHSTSINFQDRAAAYESLRTPLTSVMFYALFSRKLPRFVKIAKKRIERMCISTISTALAAQVPTKDVTTYVNIILYFINLPVVYGSLTRPKRKTGFIVFILCSLLTMAHAATDCEILNSGISSISTACCTETAAIVCVNDRVTEMLEFSVFNSISNMDGVKGHLPLEIGNLTELIKINIEKSDLSAGPVPESIGLCTKLVKVRFRECKLEGEFPEGVRELKSLGNIDG